MNAKKTSWIAQVLIGNELRLAEEEARKNEQARTDAEVALAALQGRVGELEAELKVRTDIMNVTSIVSEADKKGDILSINDKFIEVSKYSREELLGKPHNTTRHPDMPKETFKQLWSTIGRGEIFRGVIKNRAKDGTPYYVDAVIAPILGENGKPMKYLGVRYDITEAEIERQNARGILGAIDATYAYIEFDLSGNVLTANANFLKLLGYQRDEVLGRHHRRFVDPVHAASPAYQQFWTDLKAGKAQSDTFKRITKTGHDVHIQAVYAPVKDEMGRVVKVVKIATDVTEQFNAARMLEQAVAQAREVTTAAREGDLTSRIPMEGKSGPIEALCGGVNTLLDTTSVIFEDVGRVLGALAAGDLSQRVTRDYAGTFGRVKDDANATSEKLATIIEDVGRVFSGMAEGDLTQRITRDAEGVFDQVKQDANSSCEKLASIIEEVRAAADALTGAAGQVSATAQSLSQAASEQASGGGGDHGVDRHDVGLDHAEQRQRPRHRRHGHQGQQGSRRRRRGRDADGGGDEADRPEDQHRRRHRLPDQPAGAERRHRGGPRRRARQGLCGGGRPKCASWPNAARKRPRRSATWPATACPPPSARASCWTRSCRRSRRPPSWCRRSPPRRSEQSQSVTQIGGAMGQLSKATQQNASASEELAATSEELSGQAEQLQQSVAFFNLGGEAARAATLEGASRQRPRGNAPALRVAARGNAAGRGATPAKGLNGTTGGQANFRPY
jgi:methyl-accepting chemotaxis protein